MGAHTVTDVRLAGYVPRTRHRAGRQRLWALGALAVGCVAAVGVWYGHPRVAVGTEGRSALAMVRVRGFEARIVGASVRGPGVPPEPLRVRANRLWPTRPLPSGARVTVDIRSEGIFGLGSRKTAVVVTPPTPHLVSHQVTTAIGARPELTFRAPVAQVQIGPDPGIVNAHSAVRVSAGPRATVPGLHGRFFVRARARTWEAFGSRQAVDWAAPPWLRVAAATGSATAADPAATAVRVTFSSPVRNPAVSGWRVTPHVPGTWHRVTGRTWSFRPVGAGFAPDTPVTVRIPGGTAGPRAVSGSYLVGAQTLREQVPQATTLRLQEWLAQLGYLPVSWKAKGAAALPGWQSAYDPPAGGFTWRYRNVPASLKALWSPVNWTVITQGAVLAFEKNQGLPVNGIPGPSVWAALRHAVATHQMAGKPYAYVRVSETLPERLWLWVGGHTILTTLANTGVPKAATAPGTFPVDLRLRYQVMRGRNPNGTRYASPVHWINYFHGSDAVHGFVRARYGFPQSDGCVEVPPSVAGKIYPHLYIGALVTVQGAGAGSRTGPTRGA